MAIRRGKKPIIVKKSSDSEENKPIETKVVQSSPVIKKETTEPVRKPIQSAPSNVSKNIEEVKINKPLPEPEKEKVPEYGEITNYTKKDIYKLICRFKGLDLDPRNPIIKIFEKNTTSLMVLSKLKEKNINGDTIDTIFDMYRNICTSKPNDLGNISNQNVLISNIAPTLTDIIEYAFKFIKNTYERRKVLDKDHINRTYTDAIESIHERTL